MFLYSSNTSDIVGQGLQASKTEWVYIYKKKKKKFIRLNIKSVFFVLYSIEYIL